MTIRELGERFCLPVEKLEKYESCGLIKGAEDEDGVRQYGDEVIGTLGLINKYYDLAQAGDALAKDHYMNLEKTAQDCISCGHCDSRCPFHVEQGKQMQEIRAYFGK